MTFRSISPQNSQSTNWRQVNDMQRDLSSKERVQIFKDDAGVRRVLLGKGANGFYGLRVSAEGKDVFTAQNTDLIFNSDDKSFIIVDEKELTLTFTRSSSTFGSYVTSLPHGLSYTPEFSYDLFLDPAITGIPATTKFSGMFVLNLNVAGTYTPFGQAYVTIDATNINFQIDISNLATGTYTNTAKVYLSQVPFGVL